MAEGEEQYLADVLAKGICPTCHGALTSRIGSGRFKDGVFCSLDCYAKWHDGAIRERAKAHWKSSGEKAKGDG